MTAGVAGTGNDMLPSPSFTYTKTFCNPPSAPVTTVSVTAPGLMHRGSEAIEIGRAAGAWPENVMRPVTVAAVAGSTGLATGAGAAGAGGADSPPPHAGRPTARKRTSSEDAGTRADCIRGLQPSIIDRGPKACRWRP